MKPPIETWSREDILLLNAWRCSHGHTGLVHYNCWRKEHNIKERVGFIDIETSSLDANFGIILSWCIKEEDGEIASDLITKEDLYSGSEDLWVVKKLLASMRGFDRLIGHYSRKFDIPFIRTRALFWGLDFPKYGDIAHNDVWRMAKDLLRLNSNRQDVVAEALGRETIKTRLAPALWRRAGRGDAEALEYILDHNKKDVAELELNYKALKDYTRRSNISI